MQLTTIKLSIAAAWILGIGAVGVLTDASAISTWFLLGAAAVFPPLAMMRFWNDPDQTMSESIQKALR